jgi:hypothetical protein
MKKFLVIFSVILFVFRGAGAASPIPYTDIYDVDHYYMDWYGSNSSVSWTFDITDDGFDHATQDVTSAFVTLNLSDDSWDWFEIATLDVGTNKFLWEVDSGDISFTITSLITLSEYGTVDATVRSKMGDFYFNTATLFAEGTELIPTAHAAEPATMFMFGTGLIGMAFIVRKKFGKV